MRPVKINKPLSKYATQLLKTYLQFPEEHSFTALDWKAEDGEFLDNLTKGIENRFLYGISNNQYFCELMRSERGFHKVSESDYRSEAKITNEAFSLMIVNPTVDSRIITELFETVDPFNMPNFEEEVYSKVMREEQERQCMKDQISSQIDFGDLNADNTERKEEESEEDKEQRIQKKIKSELEKRVKAWRMAMREQQKKMASMRWDNFLLARASTYLRPGGILVMMTPKELIDDNIAFKLVNQFEDIRILRLDDDEYKDYRKCIILAKKRQKATREDHNLGKEIARTKERPYKSFGQIRDITVTKEEDPEKYEYQVFQQKVDSIYGVLEIQHQPIYRIPVSKEEDITSFRVGPITANEALSTIRKSKVITTYQEKYSQVFTNKNPVTPTPLHKGHIMLLLTSGFLNGYIGTGPDQHLVKGSAIKDIREFQETDDDGNSRVVEREFYNIGVKLLNAQGQFRKIM